MLGIKHYNPKIYTNPSDILKDHKVQLERLKGKHIKEIWVAWEQDSDEWFRDCPVIIRFEECQIELCAFKWDEYFITFDKISVLQDIEWYGTDLRIQWEMNKIDRLNFAINKCINDIEIIERCDENSTDFCYLEGIGFQLNDGYFAVSNGLDENLIITDRQEDPNYNRTNI
ncbi:hypothetical protein ORD22_02095 [Sporosarcina sp. GW1-11]|uniref:hypothetical protein n=1 Tax=Sporosarcina sp. GW1-11 TaxID=2899126 RepID=UPI00294E1650|nr:hypothetical protein [Sporosarcina sp. GW1-11]MDV6377055.1 hypothetical protein [Sporosarcina sp. GW1-11]